MQQWQCDDGRKWLNRDSQHKAPEGRGQTTSRLPIERIREPNAQDEQCSDAERSREQPVARGGRDCNRQSGHGGGLISVQGIASTPVQNGLQLLDKIIHVLKLAVD
jgi:hypothetical protein